MQAKELRDQQNMLRRSDKCLFLVGLLHLSFPKGFLNRHRKTGTLDSKIFTTHDTKHRLRLGLNPKSVSTKT